jgi:hypothetical protein
MKRRPDVSADTIEKYLHNRLVLPDDVPGHPLQTSIDVASLAPNAEITVYPWKVIGTAKLNNLDPQAWLADGTVALLLTFQSENFDPTALISQQ